MLQCFGTRFSRCVEDGGDFGFRELGGVLMGEEDGVPDFVAQEVGPLADARLADACLKRLKEKIEWICTARTTERKKLR